MEHQIKSCIEINILLIGKCNLKQETHFNAIALYVFAIDIYTVKEFYLNYIYVIYLTLSQGCKMQMHQTLFQLTYFSIALNCIWLWNLFILH